MGSFTAADISAFLTGLFGSAFFSSTFAADFGSAIAVFGSKTGGVTGGAGN